jgi:hypothetical protein
MVRTAANLEVHATGARSGFSSESYERFGRSLQRG